MTEREKIIKVIDKWASKAVTTNKFDGASVYNPHNAAELADALIAAGIGDLKEHRIFAGKDGSIKQLYSGEEVEQIVKEREEYKHRAEVAERALDKACEDIEQLMDCCRWAADGGVITIKEYTPENATPQAYIDRTEKELAEEGKDD